MDDTFARLSLRSAPRGGALFRALGLLTASLFAASGCSEGSAETDPGTGRDQGVAESIAVVVNEVFPHGADELTDPDWAELKNTGSVAADLTGYRLRDDKTTAPLPSGTVIAPGAYLVVYCDDVPDGGALDRIHVPFKLGGADELHLLRPDGNKVDGVVWDATLVPSGKSYGRLPDGTGQWAAITPSPGKRNGV